MSEVMQKSERETVRQVYRNRFPNTAEKLSLNSALSSLQWAHNCYPEIATKAWL